jgi:hypothetical protein
LRVSFDHFVGARTESRPSLSASLICDAQPGLFAGVYRQLAIVSSENRLRAAMNRRIGRSDSSAAISLREAVVCSSKIRDASGSLKIAGRLSVSGLTAFRSVDAADTHADLAGLGFHREGVAVSD